MLNQNARQLGGIVFTHEHADHTAGLDDIRPFFFRQGNINMYMSARVQASLKQRFDYIFNDENKISWGLVNVHTIDKANPFCLGNKKMVPIEVLHYNMPVMGYRIDNFAYLTDVKTIAPEEKDKLKGLMF